MKDKNTAPELDLALMTLEEAQQHEIGQPQSHESFQERSELLHDFNRLYKAWLAVQEEE